MAKIFPVYKPKGITSYDVIRRLKKRFPGEKIGHGGTLDPLAEGVLVVGVGRQATKRLGKILKNTKKEYIAEVELGKTSETDDSQGPIGDGGRKGLNNRPNLKQIQKVLKEFIGVVNQVPPKYSAVKIKGTPAYKLVRKGKKIKLKPRRVSIYSIDLISYRYPNLKIKVVCGSGVYIRALARDIGKKLKNGAYLKSLTRTAVGQFRIEFRDGV